MVGFFLQVWTKPTNSGLLDKEGLGLPVYLLLTLLGSAQWKYSADSPENQRPEVNQPE